MTREKLNAIIEALLRLRQAASDKDALVSKDIYPEWRPGMQYKANIDRILYQGHLYSVRQDHTSQEIYPPSLETASIYTEIALNSGSGDDTIEYNNNMELEEGKHYMQNGVKYVCIRSTGIPVYNNLSDLVHIYVEICD